MTALATLKELRPKRQNVAKLCCRRYSEKWKTISERQQQIEKDRLRNEHTLRTLRGEDLCHHHCLQSFFKVS